MSELDKEDAWHFVWHEKERVWSWKRTSATGDEVTQQSLYTFASFNVCVADAERAGFVNNTRTVRRVRTSELPPDDASAHLPGERRRRSRKGNEQ